jgi:hypothetical protein
VKTQRCKGCKKVKPAQATESTGIEKNKQELAVIRMIFAVNLVLYNKSPIASNK